MVLSCISLMISHFEYLSVYWPSAYFLYRNILKYIGLVFLLLSFRGSLYILDTNTLSDI